MGAGSNTGLVPRRSKRVIIGQLSSLVIIAMLAVPIVAFAGKGGGGASTPAWITLASVSGRAAAEPSLGSAVKFATGYATSTKNPWVSVYCYQDGTLVYAEGNNPSADYVLGGASSAWKDNGGAATCRAELGDLYWRGGHQSYTYLAHVNFDAGG